MIDPIMFNSTTDLFNSGAFNEIALGYLDIAMKNLDLPKETQKKLKTEMYYAFDMHTAEEALNYYNHGKI